MGREGTVSRGDGWELHAMGSDTHEFRLIEKIQRGGI